MFNLGPMELMLIVAAGLIFLGPKELPKIARKIGQSMREIRGAARDFSQEIHNPMAPDPELDENEHRDLGDPTAPVQDDEFEDHSLPYAQYDDHDDDGDDDDGDDDDDDDDDDDGDDGDEKDTDKELSPTNDAAIAEVENTDAENTVAQSKDTLSDTVDDQIS